VSTPGKWEKKGTKTNRKMLLKIGDITLELNKGLGVSRERCPHVRVRSYYKSFSKDVSLQRTARVKEDDMVSNWTEESFLFTNP